MSNQLERRASCVGTLRLTGQGYAIALDDGSLWRPPALSTLHSLLGRTVVVRLIRPQASELVVHEIGPRFRERRTASPVWLIGPEAWPSSG